MSNYITEAFKKFNLLESEDISLNAAGIEELRSFMDEAGVDPDEEVIEIYDMNAQAEDELKQSYLGKAILECKVCHSYIFEDRKNIGTDVEGNCCTDIECPYCLSTDGFIVIGEVAPYSESESEELIADQKDDDLPEVDVEGAADEIEEDDIVEENLDDQEADDDEHKDEAEEKIDEGMKLDGVKELYDNDEIRGVEDIEGDKKLEGDDRIRGDKHKAPISESYSYELYDDVCREYESLYPYDITLEQVWDEIIAKYGDEDLASDVIENLESYARGDQYYEALDPADRMSDEEKLKRGWVVNGKKRVLVATPDGKAVPKIIDTDEPDSKASDFVDESCNSKKVDESIEGAGSDAKNRLIRALDFKERDGVSYSKELFFEKSIPPSGPYESPIGRVKLELTDVDNGVGQIELSAIRWWTERGGKSYRDIQVDSWDKIISLFKRNPLKSKRLMALIYQFDSEINGSLEESCDSNKVDESCDSEKIDESIEDVSVTTEDEVMTMATKDDGGVVIETTPKEDEMEFSGEEMIVPMSDESSEEVEAAVDANSIEDGEEDETFDDIESEMSEDEFAIDDFDEFDEESFNGLGESYLKSCYENVTGFKTSGVSTKGNKLFIEGIIKFDSGNEKKTNFVFESVGNHKFEGYNEQISRGKKTFKLNSSVDNKKLVCESLNYNYRSKNELNESVRVYGTVKRK